MPDLRSDVGFSLLEVLVAVAILSLAFAALFPIFGSAPKVLSDANEASFAVELAQAHLEEAALMGACSDVAAKGEQDDWGWEVTAEAYEGEDVTGLSSYPCQINSYVWKTERPERVLSTLSRVVWVQNK